MNKFFKNVLFYLLIIMVIIWMFDLYGEKNSKPADISYTSFMQHVQQDEIKQVTIVDNVISGKLKDGKEFSTVAPNDSKLVEKLEAKAMGKSDQIQKYEFFGLLLFVGIPLPGTGAWTGSLVAALLDVDIKKASFAIFLGLLLATVIMCLFSYGGLAWIISLFH